MKKPKPFDPVRWKVVVDEFLRACKAGELDGDGAPDDLPELPPLGGEITMAVFASRRPARARRGPSRERPA